MSAEASGGLSGEILSEIDYPPSGQMRQSLTGNGVETVWTYDRRARLTSLLTAAEAEPATTPNG